MTTPTPTPTPDSTQLLLEQASNINLFGHTFNIWAIMILLIFILIVYCVDKARRNGQIDWVDMITSIDQITGKKQASTTKIMQIVGGITGTFIVVKLTLQNAINWDIFGIYLTYVAGVDGFSRFMLAKYGVQNNQAIIPPPSPPPAVVTTTTTTQSLGNTKPVDD